MLENKFCSMSAISLLFWLGKRMLKKSKPRLVLTSLACTVLGSRRVSTTCFIEEYVHKYNNHHKYFEIDKLTDSKQLKPQNFSLLYFLFLLFLFFQDILSTQSIVSSVEVITKTQNYSNKGN